MIKIDSLLHNNNYIKRNIKKLNGIKFKKFHYILLI